MYFEQDGFVYKDTLQNKVGVLHSIIDEWESSIQKIKEANQEIDRLKDYVISRDKQIASFAEPLLVEDPDREIKNGVVEKFSTCGDLINYVGWAANNGDAKKICARLNAFVDEVNDLRAAVRALGHKAFQGNGGANV